jgi:outer membrane protein TolC
MKLAGLSHSRAFRRLAVAGLGLVIAVCGRSAPQEVAGTLPEAYFPALRQALESAATLSPTMLERALEVSVQQARLPMADAARLPRLGGTFDFSNNETAISENTSRKTRDSGLFYRIELNQALFHWGALKNESARARIAVALAQRNAQETHRLVALSLRQSYLVLVTKKAALVQARDRQRLRELSLKLARDKFDRGIASEGEVTGWLLAVEENAFELERQENEFAGMLRTFARTAGLREFKEAEVASDVPEVTPQVEVAAGLLAAVLRDRARSSFEVQVHELQAREADLSYRIAQVRLLPKFGATAGHYVENTTNATAVGVEQRGVIRQSIGVRADWAIFDGFAARGAKQEALASKRLAERRLDNAAERLMEEAQRQERSVALEAQAVKLTDRRRMLAAAALARLKEEVQLGNRPANELDEAAANVSQANAASAAARARYLGEWSALVSLAGADPLVQTLSSRK